MGLVVVEEAVGEEVSFVRGRGEVYIMYIKRMNTLRWLLEVRFGLR